jgi:peptidoglycan L-alanyl-D-glutamate endopeptidase CwlK
VAVVKRALELSSVDFSVVEGLRSKARQAQLVASGASRTMNSRHLIGQAVDIAPYVGGRIRWDWPLFYPIAEAMRAASLEIAFPVIWGACWDRVWSDTTLAPLRESQLYSERWHAAHPNPRDDQQQGPLIDGPHWQTL